MKKDKWLKWKAGAAFTLGIAAMFQMVRTSGQFETKTAEAAASKTDTNGTVQQQQDPVIDEWTNEGQNSSGGDGLSGRRGRHFRGGDSFGSDGSSSGTQNDDGGSSGSSVFGNGGSAGGQSDSHSSTGRS